MRNIAVFVIVVAVLALGGLWWLQGGGPAPAMPSAAPTARDDSGTGGDVTDHRAQISTDDRPRVEVGSGEVVPTREVLVRVLDFEDGPVEGASIYTRQYPDQQDMPRGQRVGVTDREGTVHVRQLQELVGEATSTRLEFECDLPGLPTDRQVIDTGSPPPEIVFRLPPSGSIVVRLLEADGSPLDARTLLHHQINLQHLGDDGSGDAATSYGLTRSVGAEGAATFGHVELGTTFTAFNVSFGRLSFRGPDRAGDRIEALLRREPSSSYLTGSLVDSDGAPLADTELTIVCSRDASEGRYDGTTDAGGTFRVWTGTRFQNGPIALFVVTGRAQSRRPGRPRARVDARLLVPGDNDLGELHLQTPEPMVSGTVFVDGRPDSSSVSLRLERRSDQGWRPDLSTEVLRLSEGSFQVFCEAESIEPLRLTVMNGDLLPIQPIEIRPRTDGLEVHLSSGGSVTATFLVDESVPFHTFTYRLRERGEPVGRAAEMRREMQERTAAWRLEPAGAGRVSLTWPALTPGIRDLSVVAPDGAQPIARVVGLVVDGGACEDPRLGAIDLRYTTRNLRIRIVGPDGNPVGGPSALVLVLDEGGGLRRFQIDGGIASLAATSALHLLVDVPGHRIVELEGVLDDREIQLERADHVALRVEPRPAALPDGFHLEVRVRPEDFGSHPGSERAGARPSPLVAHWSEVHRLDSRASTRLLARRTGDYRIALFVGADGELEEVEGAEPTTWSVAAENPMEEFVLRVPDGAIDAALERAK